MWIDDRGSEVLPISECRRLLAIGAKLRLHGHLGISKDGAPLVLPVDYTADGSDVIIRVGDQLVRHIDRELVAFQVDNASYEQATNANGTEGTWSVLVRGLVNGRSEPPVGVDLPHPRVAEPGNRLVRIRGDVITGRRLRRSGKADKAAP